MRRRLSKEVGTRPVGNEAAAGEVGSVGGKVAGGGTGGGSEGRGATACGLRGFCRLGARELGKDSPAVGAAARCLFCELGDVGAGLFVTSTGGARTTSWFLA